MEVFTFSYPEGLRYGFSHSTFAKVIRDLEKFGFIDWVAQGGLRGRGKGYNRFKLARRWEELQEPEKFVQPSFKAKKDRFAIINERMAVNREELAKKNAILEEDPVIYLEDGSPMGNKQVVL